MLFKPITRWQARGAQKEPLARRKPDEAFVKAFSPGKNEIGAQARQLKAAKRKFYAEGGFPQHERHMADFQEKFVPALFGSAILTVFSVCLKQLHISWVTNYLSDAAYLSVFSVLFAFLFKSGEQASARMRKLNENLTGAWKDSKYALYSGCAFVFASILEIGQYFKKDLFNFIQENGRYDPNDFLAYGIGAVISFIALKYNSAIVSFCKKAMHRHQ